MDRRGADTQNLKSVNPLVIAVFVLVCFNFFAFRWFGSQDKAKAAAAIEGLLRREYATANSYALSKALTDLESLGLIRCVALTEELGTGRIFYDTSNGSSCVAASPFQRLFTQESDLQAINGLVYHLMYQLPLRWQSLLLELMTYLLIATLALLYHRHMRAQQLKQAISDALINQSRQVSHDIRSPLSALNMIAGSLAELPEDKRLIIRSATQRINDIANQLLQQTRGLQKAGSQNSGQAVSSQSKSSEPVMLMLLLDSIVSEKRVQYRDRMDVEILGDLQEGYGIFASISPGEFSRVLSNLINNSVESFGGPGRVTVTLRGARERVQVIVSDNGKGIPPEVLVRLGEQGVSFGKNGTSAGFGLGLHHAKRTMREAGGDLTIQSKLNVGTTVTLTLSRAQAPQWFVEELVLSRPFKVVSADDDLTIHQIWADRISPLSSDHKKVVHAQVSSLAQLEEWVVSNRDTSLFLVDFEFIGQIRNGLDAIEAMGIGARAILVTSRFDELPLRSRAEELGVRILPKALAPFVPIRMPD